jgi:hypothetical protein
MEAVGGVVVVAPVVAVDPQAAVAMVMTVRAASFHIAST